MGSSSDCSPFKTNFDEVLRMLLPYGLTLPFPVTYEEIVTGIPYPILVGVCWSICFFFLTGFFRIADWLRDIDLSSFSKSMRLSSPGPSVVPKAFPFMKLSLWWIWNRNSSFSKSVLALWSGIEVNWDTCPDLLSLLLNTILLPTADGLVRELSSFWYRYS